MGTGVEGFAVPALDMLRGDGLTVSPEQTAAKVPLAGLTGVADARAVRS
ncbi:hypothetical protein [Streptomyces sp. NPDC004728]